MSLYERLERYVKIDTTSDPTSQTVPSTKKQLDLSNLLKEELIEMGVQDVVLDEYGYVYGKIPSNIKESVPTIGFIAHVDTSSDFSGTNVKPTILYDYDGSDIKLENGRIISVEAFPQLKQYVHNNIMVAGGDTLLGADDKAGVAAIMQACEILLNDSSILHGDIKVAFTVDEEIGRGADHFDVKGFGCDFAYTLDGDDVSYIEYENFNAASVVVDIIGKSIHPGSAKNKMINASNIALEFHSQLPVFDRPEHTCEKEGFNHLHQIKGTCEHATLAYIVRNHDLKTFENQLKLFESIQDFMNAKYNQKLVTVRISQTYANMYEILKDHMEVIEVAKAALSNIGIVPQEKPIRGGTDGATLTYKGLPCPNLGTGGQNFHGPYEYCNLTQLEKSVELIVEIARLVGASK